MNNQISKILKEIKEYQDIHKQSEEQIIKLVKNIEEIQKELNKEEIKTQKTPTPKKQKIKLSDFKRLYFKNAKIIEETPKSIELNCEKYGKSKTTQRRFTEYGETYNMPFDVSGKKEKDAEKVSWCSQVDFKGKIIPFKNNKLLLAK
jgi:hypothetical protein